MTGSGLSVIVLLSLFGAGFALSLDPRLQSDRYSPLGRHCYKLSRRCEDKFCGYQICTVVELCCNYWRCEVRTRKIRDCEAFQCQNGGVRVPTPGIRKISDGGCELPPPRCLCLTGFGGRCCQDRIDPCTYTKCKPGQTCKSKQVICKKNPCPLKAVCVSDVGICPLFPNTITTCEIKPNSCGNHSHCFGGNLCCKRGCGSECMKPLPTGTSGCDRIVCQFGTVCKEVENNKTREIQAICVRQETELSNERGASGDDGFASPDTVSDSYRRGTRDLGSVRLWPCAHCPSGKCKPSGVVCVKAPCPESYICIPPVIRRVCPSVPPYPVTNCVKECYSDKDCGRIGHPSALAKRSLNYYYPCCHYGCASVCIHQ